MGTFKLTDLERYNRALKGDRKTLLGLKGTVELAKAIDNEINAARRDVYNRGARIGLDESTGLPIQVEGSVVAYFDWPRSSSTYSEADFRQSDGLDVEGVYLDTIQVRRSIRKPFPLVGHLEIGDRVVIWLDNHYYKHHSAVVVSFRPQSGEYLVEITSKRPLQHKFGGDKDAKGRMYIRLQDIKMDRRSV